MAWKVEDWESTVEKIVSETSHALKPSGKQKVWAEWRARLEKEPNQLQAFQIDVIAREVQRRLKGDDK